jgi:hypothetical protein
MRFEDVMCAVAERLDIDETFLFSTESQDHLRLILENDEDLARLTEEFSNNDDYVDSPEFRMCIERAAFILLCDLVRAEELCSAMLARCGHVAQY